MNAKALIIVDTQIDFCEGGALAVAGGNEVAEKIRWTLDHTAAAYKEIVFTKDWHNESNLGNSEPTHCVNTTKGAMLHPELGDWYMDNPSRMFYKGQGCFGDSSFLSADELDSALDYWLKVRGIDEVHIAGINVLQTAFDAKRKGYLTNVLLSMVVS